ncbi:MAG: uroporphyrinogen decarboxylase family protein [Phycisphaerae bacterium]|jgi:uroporphyrinogen decarboxylase
MGEMTHVERVAAVLRGERPDRPPVSFWHHFAADECHGRAAVVAHLRHLERFDLDFLKVMNDNPYPTTRDVRSAGDLRDLPLLHGDEDTYGRQLELIRSLNAELAGRVMMVSTLFNAWAVLRRIVTPKRNGTHKPPVLGGPFNPADARMCELLEEDRAVFATAIATVATSQANFARRCIEAGADGVFLSVRDDWTAAGPAGHSVYEELVGPGDREILLAAGGGRFNMLHVCGVPQALERFAKYPVAVLNWADHAAGPAIGQVAGRIGPAIAGGVDNLGSLPRGRPADVEDEVRGTLVQAKDHPMLITPGCTYDPDAVPDENLRAIARAVRTIAGEGH